MGDDREQRFRRRWTELGLAETAAAMSIGATLRPASEALHDARAPLASDGVPLASLEGLPTISLDGASERSASPAPWPAGSASDLRLLEMLGEGGMGQVHLARQRSLAREVAVKTLKHGASAQAARAIVREARLAGGLDHPGVVPVHALGLDERGQPLLVMKRVEGVDWRMALGDPGHTVWRTRAGSDELGANVEVLMQICQTLAFAHARGVLHLDLKPENVMLGGYGEVYLVDWGIALLEHEAVAGHRSIVGTPAYMAPEMALGLPLDQRTDVYLLGAVLHELLTGSFRHGGTTLEEVLVAASRSEPPRYEEGIPARLAALPARATARDPGSRPATALAFRAELADFLRHRDAARLCDVALQRTSELERLVAAGPASPAELGTAYRLAAEARFGFRQSLQAHAGLGAARAGLRRADELLVELELLQDHAETARALLDECDAPGDELRERVRLAEAAAAQRRREAERLEALDRDLDPSTGRRARSLALGGLALMIAGVGAAVAARAPRATDLSARTVLLIAVGVAVVVGLVSWIMRRTLLTTVFNRRLFGLLLLAIGISIVNRAIGVAADVTLARTFAHDTALYATITAAAAVTMVPGFWPSAIVQYGGFVGCVVVPEYSPSIFVVTSLASTANLIWALWRRGRRTASVRPPSAPPPHAG